MANGSPFDRVPLVGQPAVVHEVRPIVVAQCNCGRGKPFTIAHLTGDTACVGCGAVYGIGKVVMDRRTGQVQVELLRLTPPTIDVPRSEG